MASFWTKGDISRGKPERRWRLVTASPVLVRLRLPLAEQEVHTEFEIALR